MDTAGQEQEEEGTGTGQEQDKKKGRRSDMMNGMTGDQMMAIVMLVGSLSFLMSWFRKEIKAEDQEVIDAHEVVILGLGDADQVKRIELLTGRNIRDQITVEEMLEIEREVEVLKMGNRRN